ncbi:MAG TPA: hypothetical protein VLX09_18020 [Stellaceae bacterium]|nr:hypothetical protein [Stellaceae bacterium]
MQIPFVQPAVQPPPQPPAPVAAEPVRAQAVEPARQVTASRSGGESTNKEKADTGSGDSGHGAATPKRRGGLLDLCV